jgi:hypothetical protein
MNRVRGCNSVALVPMSGLRRRDLTLSTGTASTGTLRLLENCQLVPEMAAFSGLSVEPNHSVAVGISWDERWSRHGDCRGGRVGRIWRVQYYTRVEGNLINLECAWACLSISEEYAPLAPVRSWRHGQRSACAQLKDRRHEAMHCQRPQ